MRYHIGCLPLESLVNCNHAIARLKARAPQLRVLVLPLFDVSGEDALGVVATSAKANSLYIACAARIGGMLTGFVVDPQGNAALRQSSVSEGKGAADVSILSTPYGELACLPGEDVAYAEYVRLTIFRGAEIVLNPTAEYADDRALARGLLRGGAGRISSSLRARALAVTPMAWSTSAILAARR